jgi:hypothetical protein
MMSVLRRRLVMIMMISDMSLRLNNGDATTLLSSTAQYITHACPVAIVGILAREW